MNKHTKAQRQAFRRARHLKRRRKTRTNRSSQHLRVVEIPQAADKKEPLVLPKQEPAKIVNPMLYIIKQATLNRVEVSKFHPGKRHRN